MDELFSGRPGDVPRNTGPEGSDTAQRPAHTRSRPSRRTVLVSGMLAVLTGAASGIAAAFGWPRHAPVRGPSTAPAALRSALLAEQRLLALTEVLRTQEPTLVGQVHADHAAHARAIEAAIRQVTRIQPRAGATPSAVPSGPPPAVTRAQLRAGEQAASSAAAARARRLDGAAATLLASIAACEAAHAELLR
jgi:hypothetical protein